MEIEIAVLAHSPLGNVTLIHAAKSKARWLLVNFPPKCNKNETRSHEAQIRNHPHSCDKPSSLIFPFDEPTFLHVDKTMRVARTSNAHWDFRTLQTLPTTLMSPNE